MAEEQGGYLTREQAIATLTQPSAKEWNDYRGSHPDWRPDLSGADLSNKDLVERDLRGADLSGAKLRSSNLSNAKFDNATLVGADLVDATLTKATLHEAVLTKADLTQTKLNGASLKSATLTGATLHRTDLRGATLDNAKLINAELIDADLQDASLECADLAGAILQGTNFTRADLTGTNLNKADIAIATVDFESAILIDADLSNADARGIRLGNASLNGAHLSGADLREAELGHAHLNDGNLAGANLSKAKLNGADLSGANFRNTKLHGANLTSALVDGKTCFIGARGLFGDGRASVEGIRGDEWAIYRKPVDFLGWTLLRSIGTLRVAGVSYFAIIAIVIFASSTHWYNEALITFRAENLAQWAWLKDLPVMRLPPHFGVQLFATFVLAIAATIYQLGCPAIVQLDNETRWTRGLGHTLIEYRSASSYRGRWRYVCGFLYLIAGGYTFVYVTWRFCAALVYIFAPPKFPPSG